MRDEPDGAREAAIGRCPERRTPLAEAGGYANDGHIDALADNARHL